MFIVKGIFDFVVNFMNSVLLHRSIRSASHADFSRSGGPGGQNVNKVNTKVTLRLALACLEGLSEGEFARLRDILANRITEADELVILSSEERSQKINLERAYARMEALISASCRIPKHRRPTRPTKASRERRLESKKLQGRKKARRHSADL
jgi:ribosome-associated protein